jgi:glucosylceramidase
MWHIRHIIIGTLRNHSKIALEWNLANDPNYEPHTPGGCTMCRGALTIDQQRFTRNVSYYIIAQIAKFVPPGSVRIGSSKFLLPQVAFRRPDGKNVLLVLNDTDQAATFLIKSGSKSAVAEMEKQSVTTFVW